MGLDAMLLTTNFGASCGAWREHARQGADVTVKQAPGTHLQHSKMAGIAAGNGHKVLCCLRVTTSIQGANKGLAPGMLNCVEGREPQQLPVTCQAHHPWCRMCQMKLQLEGPSRIRSRPGAH